MKRTLAICLLTGLMLAPAASWAADVPAIFQDVQADVNLMNDASMAEIRGMSNPLFLGLLSGLGCSQLRALFIFLVTNAQPCPECLFCAWSGCVPNATFEGQHQGTIFCNGTTCYWVPYTPQ